MTHRLGRGESLKRSFKFYFVYYECFIMKSNMNWWGYLFLSKKEFQKWIHIPSRNNKIRIKYMNKWFQDTGYHAMNDTSVWEIGNNDPSTRIVPSHCLGEFPGRSWWTRRLADSLSWGDRTESLGKPCAEFAGQGIGEERAVQRQGSRYLKRVPFGYLAENW